MKNLKIMNLRYIYISSVRNDRFHKIEYNNTLEWYDNNTGIQDNTEFISNYLSKEVRKLKIPVPGFNYLSITTCNTREIEVMLDDYLKVLSIHLPFSQEEMDQLSTTSDYSTRMEQYLSIYERGYKIANEYCDIHLDEQYKILNKFRNNEYRNEWLFEKKLLKEYNIYLYFKCYFTSIDFRLELEVYDRKLSCLKTKGVVLRTGPSHIFWGKEFNKGIEIEGDKLYLLDFLERRNYMFDLNELALGEFNVTHILDPDPIYSNLDVHKVNSEFIERINWIENLKK